MFYRVAYDKAAFGAWFSFLTNSDQRLQSAHCVSQTSNMNKTLGGSYYGESGSKQRSKESGVDRQGGRGKGGREEITLF